MMTIREEIKYAIQEAEIMNSGASIDKIIEQAAQMSNCPSNWVRDIYKEMKSEYFYIG
jgi:CRISPR/Cas system CSM-associated protein Csm2 small subunit